MASITWSKLFPTKQSFIVFNLYIFLFVTHALLVKSSQGAGSTYDYSTVCVVLLTEVLKLIISSALYLKEHSFGALIQEVSTHRNLLALYLIPASLYCLYNNLAFHNLAAFDPATYYLLLQFRVVITALVYQVVFSRKLSGKQWFALILLTAGCILKQLDTIQNTQFVEWREHVGALLMILLQTLCSCFAGVYNEYLLKSDGASVNIYIQNVFMYLDSILCNLAVMYYQDEFDELFDAVNLPRIFHRPVVLLIMCNSAVVGIVTSFFLKTLDSIMKVFASGLDLVLTAIFSMILFGIPIRISTALSIGIVLCAVWIYSRNPVRKEVPLSSGTRERGGEEEEALIMDEVIVQKPRT